MTDSAGNFGSLIAAANSIIENLTNLVGIFEKNVDSYDRIARKFKRKRIVSRLERILQKVTSWNTSNRATLFMIAKWSAEGHDKNFDNFSAIDDNSGRFMEHDLRNFLEALLSTQDIIEEYREDIIAADYKLYESLQDAMSSRIGIVRQLLSEDSSNLSKDRLRELSKTYEALIHSLDQTKAKLQSSAKGE